MKSLTLTFKLSPGEDEKTLFSRCGKKLHATPKYFEIVKKSLDARDKSNIHWVYTVACADHMPRVQEEQFRQVKGKPRVFVAGMGPAGLFCALRLLDHGIFPILLERGKPVEERLADVAAYRAGGKLDTESNVQFGEGGAGTFSDGKLFTQTNDPLNRTVLKTFVRFGAPPEIAYLGRPHLGSDNLPRIVAAMRKEIIDRGGEVRFSSRLTDIIMREGKLAFVEVNGKREEADALVLAVGHSARDTFEMLLSRGLCVEQKKFAVGFRVEHLQKWVDHAQYGDASFPLPPAEYKFVSHAAERAVFSFCMCPGGEVVPASSEEGGLAVNGMSCYLRDGKNANAALVAQVSPSDYGSEHPLAGVYFQRKLEQAAFAAGGGLAPVQRLGDFLARRESSRFGEVLPTYARGTAFAPSDAYLPKDVAGALRMAILDIGSRFPWFSAEDALLTGVESRTSSPIRVVRGEDLQAVGAEGVYPCGEGCGYAGGITSAAADGLRVAKSVAAKFF